MRKGNLTGSTNVCSLSLSLTSVSLGELDPNTPFLLSSEVSTTVRNLRATGEQQMLRLTHTYSSVTKKLNEIRIMGQQLKALGKAAEEVLREFDIGDISTRREYTAQIKGIERFQEELVSIQKLKERLGTEKRKVHAYRERLEKVQERIDKQKEMEIVWRQRASRMCFFVP